MDRDELTEAGKKRFTAYILRNPDGTVFEPVEGKVYSLTLSKVEDRDYGTATTTRMFYMEVRSLT